MGRRFRRITMAMVCGAVFAVAAVAGQTTGPRLTPLIGESLYGPDLFNLYCASCHGKDGRGDGPVARSLKIAPPNLTLLSRRNDGTFPSQRVESSIAVGFATPSHGTVLMPVWGPIFQSLDPSDARVRARIKSLVSYLESIQQK